MTIAWIDTETTGLNPLTSQLLEVACIITDDALNEIARYHAVVYASVSARVVDEIARFSRISVEATGVRQPGTRGETYADVEASTGINRGVVEMHHKNDLWAESTRGLALDTVDRELEAFLRANAIEKTTFGPDGTSKFTLPQLGGSTVSFDRSFIDAYLRRTSSALHYRNLDVTTLNETARRFWPELHDARPQPSEDAKAHRAMADIEASIATYKYYVEALDERRNPLVTLSIDSEVCP